MNAGQDDLESWLDRLYACGVMPGGGACRTLYDPAWQQATDLVAGWMQASGLRVRRDAVGNCWGRLEGRTPGKAVVTGSHLDTVRGGGRLDGAYGIVAGILAVRAAHEAFGPPARPVEVLATCEEEGSRFGTNFWGARAIIGAATAAEAETVTDRDGVSLAAAMASVGLDPGRVGQAARDDIHAFIELHIEQGKVLEAAGGRIGVVQAIAGTRHLAVTVTGRPDHAGTTPMDLRQDALAGAAAMVLGIERTARELGPPAVATTGQLVVYPGQVNVVPGRVSFTVDLRHGDAGGLARLADGVRRECAAAASARRLRLEIETLRARDPVAMDPVTTAALDRAARDAGVAPLAMVSGAGHDAQILAARCRVGMLFVPSRDGRSHCPEEATDPADLELGTRILGRALHDLAW